MSPEFTWSACRRDPSQPNPWNLTRSNSVEIPSLPIGVRVDRISIRDIALAEAIVGEAMVLDLSGQVAAKEGAAIRTDLRIERTDAEGLVTLVADLDSVAQSLAVDFEANEPKGGLMARVLGLTPYPPVAVTIKGEGPLDRWRATLDARAEELAVVTARLGIDRGQTTAIALDGRADVEALLDPPLRPLVAGGVTFSLSANLPDLDRVTVNRLTVDTESMSASGSGRVDLAKNNLDATVSVSVPNGDNLAALLSPARMGSVATEVKVSGAVTAPTVDLTAKVQDVAVPSQASLESLNVSAQARLSESPWGIDAQIDGDGLKTGVPAATALTGDKVRVAVSGAYDQTASAVRIERLEVGSGPTQLTGHGEFNATTQQLAAALDLKIADLSVLGEALGLPLSGDGNFTADTAGNLETLNLAGSVRGEIPRAATGHPETDELLAEGLRLSGSYSLDGADKVRFEADVEAGALLELHAEGRIGDTIQADAKLQASDLSAFSRLAGIPLSGALSMTAHAEGSVEDATGTLSAALDKGAVGEVAIPRADLKIDAKDLMQSPSGRLSLDARTGQGPVNLRTDFTLAEFKSVDLRDLAGEILGVRLAGDVRAPLDGGVIVGRLRANFEEAGEGRDIAGVRVAGRSELDVRLAERAGKQAADIDLSASSLAIAKDGDTAFQAERLSLKAALTDLLGTPRGDIRLEGQDVGSAAFMAKTVTAKVDGSLADAGFQARMEGAGDPAIRMTLAGRHAMKGGAHTVTLRQWDGVLGSYPLKLARPATITYASDGLIAIDGFNFGIGKGTIAANGRLGGARTAATVRIAGLPLDLVGQFDPSLPLGGTLGVDADVRAEGKGLGGKVSIRGRGVTHGMGDGSQVPPVDLDINAVWRGGRVDLNGRLKGIGSQDLVVTARGPLVVNARSFQPYVDQRAPIAATARWEGQLEPLWEILPLSDQRLAGQGRIAFDVTGTVAQPRPSGEVVIDNGTYEHFVAGTLIENLDLRATVDSGQVVKVTLSGTDGGAGRISGEGSANVSDLAGKLIDATVRLDRATLVRRDDVTAAASGSVAFRGTPAQGRLEGKITTDRVDIRLVNQLPPSVVTLGVTEVNAPGQSRSDEEASKPAEPSQIDLDITVDLPKEVYVQGRGLESEWGGSFHITGTTGSPRIEGSLSVIRGQFTFAGKRFKLTKGAVILDGGQEIEPRIDIVAEYTADDFTATISISGKASDPKLALSSSPPLPQEEILPRVLFGKNASQLSALEAAQLAIAVQSLASGGGGFAETALSKVQNTLGIDVLSVESTGEDGTGAALRAGKHIGDNIYVETVQGTEPGSTVYRVEVEIFDNIAAESSVSQGTGDTSGSVGLKWEYRY